MPASDNSLSVLSESIQEDLNAIVGWLKVNDLILNTRKSVSMLIGSRQKLKGQVLRVKVDEHVEVVKHLGIFIDRHLSWDVPKTSVLNRAYCRLFAIRRLLPLPTMVTSLLYKSFVLPITDYCDVVWFNDCKKHARMMERFFRSVQKITGFSLSDSSNLVYRIQFHLVTSVCKVLTKICPSYLSNCFEYTKNVTGRVNRNPHSLYIQSIRTNYGKLSFYYRGAVTWNGLDSDLSSCSINSFKKLYKFMKFTK